MEFQKIDLEVVNEIVDLFKQHYNSRSNAVKTNDFLFKLSSYCKPQKFRAMLGYIRKENLTGKGFIVSNVNAGYWYTECTKEKNEFLQQELNRIANQYANIEQLHIALKSHRPKTESLQQTFFDFN